MAGRPKPPGCWRGSQLCALLAVVGLMLVDGCANYGNKAFRLGDGAKIQTPEYDLRFIEADDEGWLWSPQQASDATDAVTTSAAKVDTFVVLFVHGWHHSSRCCDDNIEGFKETLSRLHTQLVKLSSRAAPAGAHSGGGQSENFRLIRHLRLLGPFRWGRILGEWFTNKPYNENEHERESERQALGIYSLNGLQITHRLQPLDPKAALMAVTRTHTPEPFCAQSGTCECQWLEWRNPVPTIRPDSLSWEAGAPKLDRYDFSQETIFNNVVLTPAPGATAYQPFVVASAHPAIIDGHSGIFSGPFIDFLTSYIGFIEGKEYQLTVEGRQSKHTSPQEH